jgi:hypothetical protein
MGAALVMRPETTDEPLTPQVAALIQNGYRIGFIQALHEISIAMVSAQAEGDAAMVKACLDVIARVLDPELVGEMVMH